MGGRRRAVPTPDEEPMSPCRCCPGLLAVLLAAPWPARADEAVDRYVQTELRQRHIPGLSLAVVRDGKVVLARGYGLANVEDKTPAAADTVYELASVSKQFIAAGIMIVVQEGKVDLDAPVSRYLTDSPAAWKDITVRHLLTHTAGLMRQDRLGPRGAPSEEEQFKAVAGLKVDAAPGEKWAYSNVGYNLLGLVIQRVTGKSWDAFLTERVFRPLGMSNTRRLDASVNVPNRAVGYVWTGEAWRKAPSTPRNLAAGGLLTTVTDLAKWDAALYTDTPLTRASRDLMWTPARLKDGSVVKTGPRSYGFGWALSEVRGHKLVAHGGTRPGFSAFLARFVDDRLTVVVLTNLNEANPSPLATGVAGFYVPGLKAPPGK
jgi:CubicO group peptidase (beta-lactamase class C family)